jgi:hypothetical protein
LISQRTKAALAAAKAKGTVLGGWRATRKDGSPRLQPKTDHATRAAQAAADAFAWQVGPLIQGMRQEGMSLNAVAGELSRRGIRTAQGRQWTAQAGQECARPVRQGVPHRASSGPVTHASNLGMLTDGIRVPRFAPAVAVRFSDRHDGYRLTDH